MPGAVYSDHMGTFTGVRKPAACRPNIVYSSAALQLPIHLRLILAKPLILAESSNNPTCVGQLEGPLTACIGGKKHPACFSGPLIPSKISDARGH